MGQQPHFELPLDLPHAGRVSEKIAIVISRLAGDGNGAGHGAILHARELVQLLEPCARADENPDVEVAREITEKAAMLGRRLVDEIERAGLASDRLGQLIRNLFECLAMGKEGAVLSLRAGENPDSLLRP